MTATKKSHLENKITAYGHTLDLMYYEGELVWSRYSSMLTVHTILLGIIGLFIKDAHYSFLFEILLTFLSICGIVLSILWFETTSRGFAWNSFWTLKARDIEEDIKIENKYIDMFTDGAKFKIDNRFTFRHPIVHSKNGPSRMFHRPWYSRLINTENTSYWIIYVFFSIYLALLMFNIGIISAQNIKF